MSDDSPFVTHHYNQRTWRGEVFVYGSDGSYFAWAPTGPSLSCDGKTWEPVGGVIEALASGDDGFSPEERSQLDARHTIAAKMLEEMGADDVEVLLVERCGSLLFHSRTNESVANAAQYAPGLMSSDEVWREVCAIRLEVSARALRTQEANCPAP